MARSCADHIASFYPSLSYEPLIATNFILHQDSFPSCQNPCDSHVVPVFVLVQSCTLIRHFTIWQEGLETPVAGGSSDGTLHPGLLGHSVA